MQGEPSVRVNRIIRDTLNSLDSSEPLRLTHTLCDLLKYFSADLVSVPEQISLSLRLLDQGILDIVIDLLSSLNIDLATYVNLLTLSVTLLTTPNNPNLIKVGEDKISRIVEYLLTAAHNALSVLLSNWKERQDDLYPAINACLALLQELASNFPVVRSLAITSYTLLHLVVEDDGTVTSPILSCLFSLLEMAKDQLHSLKPKIIYNILDELILKLTQNDQIIACLSLDSIRIILFHCTQLQPVRLTRRYKGSSQILRKWFGNDFDELLEEVVLILDPSFRFEDGNHRAAQVIQSVWRGYRTRKGLGDLRESTVMMQRRFRLKNWLFDFNRRCDKAKLLKELQKQDSIREESIRLQTEFFKTLERLPARRVRGFLAKRQFRAVLTIQQWWRRMWRRKVLRHLREERNAAAVKIQKCFRKFLAGQNTRQTCPESNNYEDIALGEFEEKLRLFQHTRKSRNLYSDEELEKIGSKVAEIVIMDSLDYPIRNKLLQNCDDLLKILENKLNTQNRNQFHSNSYI